MLRTLVGMISMIKLTTYFRHTELIVSNDPILFLSATIVAITPVQVSLRLVISSLKYYVLNLRH